LWSALSQFVFGQVCQDQAAAQQIIIGQAKVDVLLFPAGLQYIIQFHQVQVLGGAGQGSPERHGDLADRALSFCQKPQDQHSLGTAEDFAESCLSLGEELDIRRKDWFHKSNSILA
jgi:hypothetical protein